MNGKQVFTSILKAYSQKEIDLSQISAGIYTADINCGTEHQTKRPIKSE